MLLTRVDLDLREAREEDQEFLYRVYASTRAEEMAVTGWPAEAIETFLRDQFRLQDLHYRRHYPGACFQLVFVGGVPVGRLYRHSSEQDLRVMDLALLPEFRGLGLGKTLLRSLMAEAEARGCSVSLHVEAGNPARDWYRRLGFQELEEDGVYVRMERPFAPKPGTGRPDSGA